jgi:hypothetical protein
VCTWVSGDGKKKILKKIENGFLKMPHFSRLFFVLFTISHPCNFMKAKETQEIYRTSDHLRKNGKHAILITVFLQG